MSEPKLISPMLDDFLMGDPISDHDGVRCYPAIDKNTESRYIVKIISMPANQTQFDALLLSGAYNEPKDALSYFEGLANDILSEVDILDQLSKLEGFVPFVNHQLVPRDNETGYDVYLLSEYHYTLQKRLRQNTMTHLEAVNLGLDICAALSLCRRSGYLYADLKPENIYITEDNSFRIGDLGFIKLSTLKYASLPDRYRSQYTAPEIADAYAALNTTMDVFSAGLILYQVYNNGVLPVADTQDPSAQIPAPAFADYEMAEIILKACSLNPEDRWQDPIELGQAIVDYMQRNGVNNTPITPVADDELTTADTDDHGIYESDAEYTTENAEEISSEDENEPDSDISASEENNISDSETQNDSSDQDATSEATDIVTEEDVYTEDEEGNLTFIDSSDDTDETIPGAEAETIAYEEVSAEVSDMMEQADELIAHQTPEPVVQPEAIEIPIPEPIIITNEASDEVDDNANEETSDAGNAEIDTSESAEDEETAEDDPVLKRSHQAIVWIRNVLLILLAAAVLCAGVFFYRNYYLQPIESIVLEESDDGSLTVFITSKIDETKLTVICSDTYGNQLYSSVKNGKAVFTGLAPNSAYTVRVDVAGFHKLIGDTTAGYTTPLQTNIVSFSAVTGSEETSIILSFAIDGPDSEQWKISYIADDNNLHEAVFAGHTVTLNGFTVGNAYTFTLEPISDVQVTGTTEVTYTASKIIKAKNLMITSCNTEGLSASWAAPADATVESWTVRCYSDNGFDETTVMSETTATFKVPDTTSGYTIEVTAGGMSISERAFAAANSCTISNFTADSSTAGELLITWDSDKMPEGGWIVLISVDNSAAQEVRCQENSTTLSPAIPGATYLVTIQAADSSGVLGGILEYTIPEAARFEGYAVNADLMEFSMCRTPSYDNWDRYALSDSDYTTEFHVGEAASFLIYLKSAYNRSSDDITTLFVIRNESGVVVDTITTTATWQQMWYRNYCELDIPRLPQTPGRYTISVFFNYSFATNVNFTIL